MPKTITVQEAREKLVTVVENHYSGADFPMWAKTQQESIKVGDTAYFTYESLIWGGEATVLLYQRLRLIRGEEPRFYVHISWSSSSHRTVAQAHAALETYRQALQFATLLEATIQGFPEIVEEQS